MRSFTPLCALALISGANAASVVVSSQNPDNYWTLDETGSPLIDSGNGTLVNGTLQNGANSNGASLLFDGSGTGVEFNGTNQDITIPNSVTINTGTYDNKTLSLSFTATTVDTTRRILWEQGGQTRGHQHLRRENWRNTNACHEHLEPRRVQLGCDFSFGSHRSRCHLSRCFCS